MFEEWERADDAALEPLRKVWIFSGVDRDKLYIVKVDQRQRKSSTYSAAKQEEYKRKKGRILEISSLVKK